jgi:predicted TIM-barrel fold metal-dependent hydrolase
MSLLPACAQTQHDATVPRIYLDQYEPNSMLHVEEHKLMRARYPLIDCHTHMASQIFGRHQDWIIGRSGGAQAGATDPARVEQAVAKLDRIVHAMDSMNIQMCLDLTGGSGEMLKKNVADLPGRYHGRFLECMEPTYVRYPEPGYANWQADQVARDKQAGAVGIKVLKTLGLFLRERVREGPLVKIDDPKFDPMWEAAGAAGLPILIHIADPDAYFLPIEPTNERYDGLYKHPGESYYGQDFPKKDDLLAALNRVIARHPKTIFVGLHVANNSENLDEVSEWFRRYPNLHCEFAARISELGRQPRRSRKFFDEFQDRIMFGTDGGGLLGPALYSPYFRFLETLDEYFEYRMAPEFNQGRWRIYGIGLPDDILKKVYHNNAARLLNRPLI